MSDAENAILKPLEDIVGAIPGGKYPMGRAIIFGGVGGLYMYYAKPRVSFTEQGVARPWVLMHPNADDSTWFPYWMWIVVPGALASYFL